ncbi:vacuolar protein sorting-associated protein 33A [Achlya hypogyna]|uniref:Vacuolar protein sorting-associated protein 33A n=1 Tax=Achlya hypogyna TaxID=1202772 RepID=A0A1V9YWX1_ACHHY|nr:vacuolar protein sorting-associated protein 33A [Achlya hypogyna]
MAARVASLENSPVNIGVFREDTRRLLFDILGRCHIKDRPTSIALVLDPELSGLFQHILVEGASVLKDYDVVQFRELSPDIAANPGSGYDVMVFIVRPTAAAANGVATIVKSLDPKKIRFHMLCTPKRTLACDELLKKAGVHGSIVFGEFPMDLVPYEEDVLTLELNDGFRDLFVDNEKSCLQTVATSINKLQILFGLIPQIKYKGAMAKVAVDMVAHMQKKQKSDGVLLGSTEPEIDTLIVLDRTVDLVTPLCTPFTYEGLLDEIIGIQNGSIRVASELVEDPPEKPKAGAAPPPPRPAMATVPLNSSDDLFAEIRDMHTERLGTHLQHLAKDIRDRHEEFRKKNASISEIRDFVKRIPGLQQQYKLLNQHTNLAQLLKKTTDSNTFNDMWFAERSMLEGQALIDELEEFIGDQEPLLKVGASANRGAELDQVLRLLCLQSLTSGGIKAKAYDHLRREIIQTYGFEMLLVLTNLEKIGLLRRQDSLFPVASSSAFLTVRKSLRLINENVNVMNPKDIAYVTKGYAPLSVRLVEIAATNKMTHTTGWRTIQDTLKQLPGPSEEISQVPNKTGDADHDAPVKKEGLGEEDRKVMVVYFIGGVTFMEIAALRHLSKQPECPYDIIIATTKIINGSTLIKSVVDKELLQTLKL